MIGLGAGGGAGDAGSDSLAALLTVIADQKAAKDRLAELVAKSKEANIYLEQAKAENLKTEALRAEIAPQQAAIDAALKAQALREATLDAKEEKLKADSAALNKRSVDLASAEAAALANDKTLTLRDAAIRQAEYDSKTSIDAALVELDKTVAKRKQQIEDDCMAQIQEANRLQALATERLRQADATLADAKKKQADYESRLAKLQELVKGN